MSVDFASLLHISLFYQPICFASLSYISIINFLASLHCYISRLQVYLLGFGLLPYLIYKSTGFATCYISLVQFNWFHLVRSIYNLSRKSERL